MAKKEIHKDFSITKNAILIVAATEAIYTLPVESVIRIQAMSNYSRIYLSNNRMITVAKVLGWFQQKECMQTFIRTHRKHLVNKKFIQQMKTIGNDGSFVFLLNGDKISVSRRRKKMTQAAFGIAC